MKLSQLKQIIKEEIKEIYYPNLNSPTTGIIRFGQLKQAVAENYDRYISDFIDNEEIYDDRLPMLNELNKANNVEELVNILDGLGFNGIEAYDFIFDSILT